MSDILVISRYHLEKLGPVSDGVLPQRREAVDRWLQHVPYEFRPRDRMELDPSYKQLIPYVIVVSFPPDAEEPQILCYRRNAKAGEQRLSGKRTIGFGGHIERQDVKSANSARICHVIAANRELQEELPGMIQHFKGGAVLGLINDDRDEVGSVHLGVLHVAALSEPLMPVNGDAGHCELVYYYLHELLPKAHEFEGWSQMCLTSGLFLARLMNFLHVNRRQNSIFDDED